MSTKETKEKGNKKLKNAGNPKNDGQWGEETGMDDVVFRDRTTSEITKRDQYYTSLLKAFYNVTVVRMWAKEVLKCLFYVVMLFSMIAVGYMTVKIFDKYIENADFETLSKALPLLITSVVGFISTIIAIPLTIAKYLFNTKEDENITSIINHTQDHDTTGRQWAMEFKPPSGGSSGKGNRKKTEFYKGLIGLEENYFIDSITKDLIQINKGTNKRMGKETTEYSVTPEEPKEKF